MVVAELIELLKDMDQDANVIVNYDGGHGYDYINSVFMHEDGECVLSTEYEE